MNLTQQLLLALKARGATEVFGIPGDFALPLFGAIEKAAILPLHTLSHEQAWASRQTLQLEFAAGWAWPPSLMAPVR